MVLLQKCIIMAQKCFKLLFLLPDIVKGFNRLSITLNGNKKGNYLIKCFTLRHKIVKVVAFHFIQLCSQDILCLILIDGSLGSIPLIDCLDEVIQRQRLCQRIILFLLDLLGTMDRRGDDELCFYASH